ncbi:MAG: PEP-CTERM sorting domain-containing protein [Gemmatimonadaceae bacterium]|jgi:hypothetical protein|nr:PEP-CTERM sorting domain-containing protein [Gemmatimonadaceae bacterium]
MSVTVPARVRTFPRAVAALFFSATVAMAQTTPVGDALIDRPGLDGYSSFLRVSGHTAASALLGQRLKSVSVFGTAFNVGKSFAPVLVSMPAIDNASFSILGIGTTRTVQLGIVEYDFGLVSGTDVLQAGTRFGWYNPGFESILFNGDADGVLYAFSKNTSPAPTLGASYEANKFSPVDRAYSIQFNVTLPTTTVVPEPSTYALLTSGLLAVVAVARRRDNRTRSTRR